MAQRKSTASGQAKRNGANASNKLRANAQQPKHAVDAEPLVDATFGRDIAGLVMAVFAVASLIAVVAPSTAPVTSAIASFYHLGFGLGGFVLPIALLFVAALVFARHESALTLRTTVGVLIIFLSVIALLALLLVPGELSLAMTVAEGEIATSGGYVGFFIAAALAGAVGKPIAIVVLIGTLLAGAMLIGFSLTSCARSVGERLRGLSDRWHIDVNERPWGDEPPKEAPRRGFSVHLPHRPFTHAEDAAETTVLDDAPTTLLDDLEVEDEDEDPFVDVSEQVERERAKTTLIPVEDRYPAASAAPTTVFGNDAEAAPTTRIERAEEPPIPAFLRKAAGASSPVDEDARPLSESDADKPEEAPAASRELLVQPDASTACDEDDAALKLPPVTMLRHNPQSATSASSDSELAQTAESLQSTLAEFNLHSRVVGWISGPTVTTFKVQPGEGERVSRISSLEDDIALTLAAQSVRIFAPIPGTSLVGIEIPNRKRQNVYLGDVLPYVKGGPLELAIGRDAEGSPIVADLAKMPHLLIAGTTGSGKSVMINTIVTTLLMRTRPDDVRLIMVDPKRVELAGYNGLPHLYVPVVTEPKQAASALQWGVSEMERRLKVFERIGVRNIATFNAKQQAGAFEHYDNPPAKMPYLVIIIDELSDLMMVAGKDVEASIVRIAQLGRAAGIHLIVATQRPSSNVVTGLIKANITNRIAFNVATGIDSRVIIDQVGAEKLTGYGDMLFSKVDWGKPKRIQGCFVSDEEINEIVEFVKSQGEAEYHEEILSAVAPAAMAGGGGGRESSDDDPLVWEAAHIVVESGLGSTSGLQRRLKVGYARAGRIMDMLEEKGIVGPPDGSKPREVLLDEEGLAELQSFEQQAREDGLGGI